MHGGSHEEMHMGNEGHYEEGHEHEEIGGEHEE